MNVLNRRSRKSSFVAPRTLFGNWPESLLLLRSSSLKYLSLLTLAGIVPLKLFEFAWKNTMSSKPTRISSKVRLGPYKRRLLKFTPDTVLCLKSGRMSHKKPLYLQTLGPFHVLVMFVGSIVIFLLNLWITL